MATIQTYPVVLYPDIARAAVKKPVRRLHRRLRKDLLISALSVVAGFSTLFLTMLNVLGPSLVLSFTALSLILGGAIAWLMRVGEIA